MKPPKFIGLVAYYLAGYFPISFLYVLAFGRRRTIADLGLSAERWGLPSSTDLSAIPPSDTTLHISAIEWVALAIGSMWLLSAVRRKWRKRKQRDHGR
jgi:uncharacterized membrane protein YedE/YeeE